MAVSLAVWHRSRPPQVVGLVPPGETLVYLNLKPLRRAGWLTGSQLPGPTAPAYRSFVQDSGFDYTRDLDALACSLQGAPLKPSETTCALEGRFGARFRAWLKAHARGQHRLAGGRTAYEFPGWAQPQRPMYVIPVGTHLIATNANDPAAVLDQGTPPHWKRSFWSAPPMGYLAVNVIELAAARQIDGTALPWRGARGLDVTLWASAATGVRLSGREQMSNDADAIAARDWALKAVAAAEAELPPDVTGRVSVQDLMQRLQIQQNGTAVAFSLMMGPGTL